MFRKSIGDALKNLCLFWYGDLFLFFYTIILKKHLYKIFYFI